MKKTILQSLILGAVFATSSLYAGVPTTTVMPQPTPPAYFDGFYIGISADAVGPQDKITNEAIFTHGRDFSFLDDSTDDNATLISKNSGNYNAGGSLFAGFGKTFDSQTYLGLEIFGHYYDVKSRIQDQVQSGPSKSTTGIVGTFGSQTVTADICIKNLYSYGLDLRGGYLVTPQTMFYILFGAEMSRFEVKSEVSDSNFDFSMTNKFDKNRVGYTPGLGMETFLNQNLSLRTQWTYTFYDSFQRTITDTDSGSTLTTKIEPSRSMFSLMLSYYFG